MGILQQSERCMPELVTKGIKGIAALLVAVVLAATTLFAGISASPDVAEAAIYTSEESAQAADDESSSSSAAADDEVAIEDEENPMASGLDSAMMETTSAGVPMYVFVLAGIAVVVVFFVVSTRRLNANISKMNRSIR